MWQHTYNENIKITRQEWLAMEAETFAEALAEHGFDISRRTRVYSDFVAPASTADDLDRELEALGFEVLFVGANSDPTFVHARREAIWNSEALTQLTPALLDLAEKHRAAYDGTFIISVEEDDLD